LFSPLSIQPAFVLVVAGGAWSVLVIAAPLLGWPCLYAASHLVCHQIPARTFHLAAGPMAVCARCLGLYLGAVAGGMAALAVGGVTVPRPAASRWLLAGASVPTLLTLAGEWLWQWPIGNVVRFVAALPLGAGAAWLVARALEVDWRA
jgi:uncharacterized membrane protein